MKDKRAADPKPIAKQDYVKPKIERVDLALEETLSAGCKLWGPGSPCGDEFNPAFESGS